MQIKVQKILNNSVHTPLIITCNSIYFCFHIFVTGLPLILEFIYKHCTRQKHASKQQIFVSTYMKVKSHLGHIKIENTIFFFKNQYAKIKLQKIQQTFRKWCSLKKLTPVDKFLCLEYKNTFLMRKYISCTNINIFFSNKKTPG